MKRAANPPLGAIHIYGGVYVKEMLIRDAGTVVAQHSHSYDHLSYLAAGAVNVHCGDDFLGTFVAPAAIRIPARAKHRFVSIVPHTLVLCLHSVAEGEDVSVEAEHALELED